jgi:hypothetical protein
LGGAFAFRAMLPDVILCDIVADESSVRLLQVSSGVTPVLSKALGTAL